MEHNHLPVAFGPRSNPDRRSANLGRNHRRNLARNALEIETGHARAIEGDGIAHELLDAAEAPPLHLVAAHHIDRLRRKTDVSGDRDLGVNDLADQFRAFLSAFDLYYLGAAFFHEAGRVHDGYDL